MVDSPFVVSLFQIDGFALWGINGWVLRLASICSHVWNHLFLLYQKDWRRAQDCFVWFFSHSYGIVLQEKYLFSSSWQEES